MSYRNSCEFDECSPKSKLRIVRTNLYSVRRSSFARCHLIFCFMMCTTSAMSKLLWYQLQSSTISTKSSMGFACKQLKQLDNLSNSSSLFSVNEHLYNIKTSTRSISQVGFYDVSWAQDRQYPTFVGLMATYTWGLQRESLHTAFFCYK